MRCSFILFRLFMDRPTSLVYDIQIWVQNNLLARLWLEEVNTLMPSPIKTAMENCVDPDRTPQNATSDQGLHCLHYTKEFLLNILGPVVQSVVSLTSSLRVISLTVLADSIHNILIFFCWKMRVAFALQKLLTFFQQKISAYLRITRCKF